MSGCGLSPTRIGPTVASFEHEGGLMVMTNPERMHSEDTMKNKPDGSLEHATNTGLGSFPSYLRGVSTVSEAFPGTETGLSAYLSRKRPAVSAFPAFPRFGRGCIDG